MGVVSSSDKEFLSGFLNGSTTGFEELVARYENQVYSLCLNLTRSEAESEQILKEVFTRAVSDIESIIDGNLDLAQTFYKMTIEQVAAYEKVRHPELDGTERLQVIGCDKIEPDEEAAISEIVRTAVRTLPYEYRVVYLLHETVELPVCEIAPLLSISEVEVRAFLHRARMMVCRQVKRLRPDSRTHQAFPGMPAEKAAARETLVS